MTLTDVVGLLGLLVGTIALPTSFIIARRGRQKPDLRHATDSEVIVSPEDGLLNRGLSMSFSGRAIEKLSKTTVALWNQRGDTVRGDDIVADDKLRVELASDDVVLQARVIARSRVQNKVDLMLDLEAPSQVGVTFDFFDEGDGAVVEILHKGAGKRPRFAGTIRGAVLTTVGTARLDPDSLETAATKSRLERFKRLAKRTPELSNRRIAALFAFVAYGVLLAISTAIVFGFREGRLVDVGRYNLDTLEGQRRFAEEVVTKGAADPLMSTILPLVTGGMALTIICLSLIAFTMLTRTTIPSTIVAIRDQKNAPAQPSAN